MKISLNCGKAGKVMFGLSSSAAVRVPGGLGGRRAFHANDSYHRNIRPTSHWFGPGRVKCKNVVLKFLFVRFGVFWYGSVGHVVHPPVTAARMQRRVSITRQEFVLLHPVSWVGVLWIRVSWSGDGCAGVGWGGSGCIAGFVCIDSISEVLGWRWA